MADQTNRLSIQGLKENVESLNYCSFWKET